MYLRCDVTIDYKILAALSDPTTKQVLHTVVAGKAVRLRQLLTGVASEAATLRAIEILKEAQLIKETPAAIDDLKTYFVTASGLEVDRLI